MGLSFMIGICFIWIGFIGAISFMESWLKFRAPGLELPVGLSVGRLIFKALNRVEWACFFLIIIGAISADLMGLDGTLTWIGVVIVFILLLQTFIWLPKMDRRAELYIKGEKPEKSNFHFYYVGAELIKLGLLIYLGVHLLLMT